MGKPWFSVKSYGFGASPKGWAGWLFTLGYVLVGLLVGGLLERIGGNVAAALTFPVFVIIFIVIARLKSDNPWRWRWGDNDP